MSSNKKKRYSETSHQQGQTLSYNHSGNKSNKQNIEERKVQRNQEESKSLKRELKKKYMQEELQKILQKRYKSDLKELKNQSLQGISHNIFEQNSKLFSTELRQKGTIQGQQFDLKNQNQQIQKENLQLKKQNKKLFQNTIQLTKEVSIQSSKAQSYQKKLTERQTEWIKEKHLLSAKIERFEKQKDQIEKQVKGIVLFARKRNDQIQRNSSLMQDRVTILLGEKERLQQCFNNLQDKVIANDKETCLLNQTILQKENQINEMKSMINKLNIDISNKDVELTKNQNLMKQKEEAEKVQAQTISDNIKVIKELQHAIVVKQTQIDQKNNYIKCLQGNIQSKQIQISQLQESNHQTILKVQQSKTILSKKQIQIDNIKGQSQNIKLKLEQAERSNYQINQKMNRMQSNGRIAIRQMQEQFEAKRIKLANAQNQVRQYAQKLRITQKELSIRDHNIAQLKAIISAIKDEALKIKEEVTIYKDEINQAEELQCMLVQQTQYMKGRLQELLEAKQNLQSQLKNIEEKNKDLQEVIRQVQVHCQTNTETAKQNIQQKELIIKQLTVKQQSYEGQRLKILNQLHLLQNTIFQLTDRNNILLADNNSLKNKLHDSCQINVQKIKLLTQINNALQQQKTLFQQQCKDLKLSISQMRIRQKSQQQANQIKIKEVYRILQQRKQQTISTFQTQIKEMAITNERKSNQFICLTSKFNRLQQTLRENHEVLIAQKQQRQHLQSIISNLNKTISTHKQQIVSKVKQNEAIIEKQSSLQARLLEVDKKHSNLLKKYQQVETQKQKNQREVESHLITIRILREQNKNIEKVMADQLNQRKTIIQQLIHEKKLLYTQFQQN